MKKLLLTVLFLSLSTLAFSGYKDVVKMKLSDGCSMQDIVELKDDFNNVMKQNGYDYKAEICCLLYTSPSPRDRTRSRMPSSA